MPAPPGATLGRGFGGCTAPSRNELIRAARLILDNCGIAFGNRKVFRLVGQFIERAPNGSGHAFFLYLVNAVRMLGNLDSAATDAEVIRKKILDLFEEGSAQAANECRRLLGRFSAIREFLAENGRHIPPISGDMQ